MAAKVLTRKPGSSAKPTVESKPETTLPKGVSVKVQKQCVKEQEVAKAIPKPGKPKADPRAEWVAAQKRVAEKYGAGIASTVPMSWSAGQVLDMADGRVHTVTGKEQYQKAVTVKSGGIPCPKTWTIAKCWEYLNGDRVMRGAASKKFAVAKYTEKFGAAPPKSYTTARLTECVTTNTPGKSAARAGGLSGDRCRELIKAALAGGRLTAEQAKGRSKWKADELRAFVAKHKLSA